MRSDTCVLIVTHGRPDNQLTTKSLRRQGYTGRIIYALDDEDPTLPEYIEQFGDDVVVFSKAEAIARTDDGHNWADRASVVYARNMLWDIAREAGYQYFIALDDDYFWWYYRFLSNGTYGNVNIASLDLQFTAMVEYLSETPFYCISMSQGGDYIGGGGERNKKSNKSSITGIRKAMQVYVCDVDRPYQFRGKFNEDVTAYSHESRIGVSFLTLMMSQVLQKPTQVIEGGTSEQYKKWGTYVKTFFTVMYAPSCCKVSMIRDFKDGHEGDSRIHHIILGDHAHPNIISDKWRKES